MKVYLCGPINGCTDEECRDWRTYLKTKFKDCVDPMDRDYRGREDECVEEIVELDKKDILESDILFVNFPKPSVGTCMEILYAWMNGKYVVVVCPNDMKISPWLKYHSAIIFHNFDDAISHLKQEHDNYCD
ncbi:MAG: nucleoside 2-deoxyribosyltransferase [Paludibacteraceae bacterium]|nr:nucleoside 2-deoxyribosyltransferase [Paludibacteraceae bacterium]